MKKNININFQSAIRTSLCLVLLSGLGFTQVMAQDEAGDEENSTSYNKRTTSKEKEQSKYTMKSVEGVVVDNATGANLGGVRVQALGHEQYSTLTDEDGTYKLNVPTFVHALYFYVPEYQPLQVVVKEGKKTNASMLSEKLKGFYTDGTTINSQTVLKLDETSDLTFETELENKLNGSVRTVSRNGLPGQGAYMTIRGINSLNANTQPLIVLDGNIIDPEYDRTSLHEGYFNNILAGIDPENIDEIKVLKNGTAIYGAKGANGVIIINTKRGHSLTTKIGVRIYGGTEFTPKKLNVMDGNQYRRYLGDLASTVKDINLTNVDNQYFVFLNDNKSNYYHDVFHNNTNWQKDIYQNTFVHNYKINVEGGDDIGMYALSLGYAKSDATQKGTDFTRLNVRFNTDISISEKLKTGLDVAYNQTAYHIMDNGWSENYDMQNIGSTNVLGLVSSPMLSPYAYYYDENTKRLALSHEYAGKYGAQGSSNWIQNPFQYPKYMGINEALRNPYWVNENGRGKNKNYAEMTQININVAPKYQITKQLSVQDRFNFQLNRNNEKYFLPVNGTTPYELTDLGDITSVLKSQFTKETTINNDLRIDWKNQYGAHFINVYGGWRYNNYSYSYSYIRGYNNENDKLPNLSKNMQYVNYGGSKDNWKDMTYYLDANYNYMNRYFADFTVSGMSSSKFGKHTNDGIKMCGVSWGVFPSLQLGWLISSEPWFKTSDNVNYLKLTAGVEKAGNDDLDYYAARTYWESLRVTENTVGLYLQNIENSSIQWETTTKYNVAIEGSFLKNRLHAGLDLFWHKTDNMLTIRDLCYISGINKYWTNEGAMTNKGFELSTNAILVNKKDWKWEAGVSVGHYYNKITKLPGSNQITLSDGSVVNGYTSSIYGKDNILTAVGVSAGTFYGWQTDGVYASDAEAKAATADGYMKYPTGQTENPYKNFQAGDVRFIDQNGDGVIDNSDRVVIGNPNPDMYGNIYTSLTWKDLRLDVNFKYSLGNDIYNYQRSILESGNTTYNQTSAMVNRWTYEGQKTDLPKACYTDSEDYRNNERMSDRWIEDGSYLKLKNLRLTYKLPISNNWIQGMKVWAEGNDLLTITKYLGTDPEMSSRNSVLYQGIDNGIIPNGRSFNVGLSINL